jgi:hypothetical protein
MVSGHNLRVEMTEVDIHCQGFLALNKLKIQVYNESLLPRLSFLEIRSPVQDDYLLTDFKVLTKKTSWLNNLVKWLGFPRRSQGSILYPLIVFSHSTSTIEVQVEQVIRDGLSLPRLGLSGQTHKGRNEYQIWLDPRYESVQTLPPTEQIQDLKNPFKFSIPLDFENLPKFRWNYTHTVSIYEFMG